MNICIKPATGKTSYIIKNMYPLYLHDLSAAHGDMPNKHGLFEEEDEIETLIDQYNVQDIWFNNPGVLYPYIVYVDDLPAGFCFVASGQPADRFDAEFIVYEFFILNPFRGKGVSLEAIEMILNEHKGTWVLYTNSTSNNKVAQGFWKKALSAYGYKISELEVDGQAKFLYRFNV